MATPIRVLVLGASYGALPAVKMQLAGHPVTLVCTAATALLVNDEGLEVRLPVEGSEPPLVVQSRDCITELRAATPEAVNLAEFDLAILATREMHYASSGMRELIDRIAHVGLPTVAITHLTPPPLLRRLGIDTIGLEHCFDSATAWKPFDPALITLASPSPVAWRPPAEAANVLHVERAADFTVAAFADPRHNALLQQLQDDIDAVRFMGPQAEAVALPVRFCVTTDPTAPLASWSALLCGHYRSVQSDLMRSVADAVHDDIAQSRQVYEWVDDVCTQLGVNIDDHPSFDSWAESVRDWRTPSSTANALATGAVTVERTDRLVQALGARQGRQLDALDRLVTLIDEWLAANRTRQATPVQPAIGEFTIDTPDPLLP